MVARGGDLDRARSSRRRGRATGGDKAGQGRVAPSSKVCSSAAEGMQRAGRSTATIRRTDVAEDQRQVALLL